MVRFLFRAVVAALGLALAAYMLAGVSYDGIVDLLIAAVVLGVVNAILRPILFILTLPLTIITLGLFLIVINALLFWAAGSMLSGFHVAGFWTAVLGAILYSLLCMAVDALLRRAA